MHMLGPWLLWNDLVCELVYFYVKNFPVERILESKRTKTFDGAALVQRLQSGVMYKPQERTFLTKTVCRYLMSHCQT